MSKFIIYKLFCNECDDVYIGSTENFKQRKKCHKSRCNNENDPAYNYKVYQKIREYRGWDNWNMVCIEECDESIKTKKDARDKEQDWINKINSQLNSIRAFKTKQDKSDDNKIYYQENKEDIKEKRKEAYWADPEKDHEKCRKWRENNPDKVAEANKRKNERWQEIKDEKNAEKREIIECGCGAKHTKGIIARHSRTKKHQDWLNSCATCC